MFSEKELQAPLRTTYVFDEFRLRKVKIKEFMAKGLCSPIILTTQEEWLRDEGEHCVGQ